MGRDYSGDIYGRFWSAQSSRDLSNLLESVDYLDIKETEEVHYIFEKDSIDEFRQNMNKMKAEINKYCPEIINIAEKIEDSDKRIDRETTIYDEYYDAAYAFTKKYDEAEKINPQSEESKKLHHQSLLIHRYLIAIKIEYVLRNGDCNVFCQKDWDEDWGNSGGEEESQEQNNDAVYKLEPERWLLRKESWSYNLSSNKTVVIIIELGFKWGDYEVTLSQSQAEKLQAQNNENNDTINLSQCDIQSINKIDLNENYHTHFEIQNFEILTDDDKKEIQSFFNLDYNLTDNTFEDFDEEMEYYEKGINQINGKLNQIEYCFNTPFKLTQIRK